MNVHYLIFNRKKFSMHCTLIFLSFLALTRVSKGEDSVLTPILEVRMIGQGQAPV